MSKLTVKQAAWLTGKSRETINAATQNGTLSFSRNSRKHKVIDVAELERVYPLVKTLEDINKPSAPVSGGQEASDSDIAQHFAVAQQKLASSEALYELLTAERERERRQLESEIENLRSSLEKAQEQHNKALLLITDQSQQDKKRGGDWEASLEAMREQIANQTQSQIEALQKRHDEEYSKLKRALYREVSKSWWDKLFEKRRVGAGNRK